MPDKQTAPSDDNSESTHAHGEDQGASTDWRAENTRLRQELARTKDTLRQVHPLAELGHAIKQAPGGAEIIRRLEKGEPLTAKQEQVVQRAAETTSDTTGWSEEKLAAMLKADREALREELRAERRAEEDMRELDAKAAKELPGYEELRKTPGWKKRLSVVLNLIGNEAIAVPDDEPNPYYFAIKEAYETILANNPELGKIKKVPKSESERRGAIVKASPKSSGAPEEEEIPEELAFARRPIRRTGIGGFGKSLQEIRKH